MSTKNISNQKSVLAKLLAQENITVEHRKISTAYFDPKNRILGLPIWKDMSPDVYDLLVGHEVGHAWETPPEGWHSAIEEKGKGFKSFLNVVEDARIEKLIKNRYPGLRAPMYRGYKELFDQDFFGVRDRDPGRLSLIDRLNLHFKLGSLTNIPFKNEEQPFVTRMDNLKSWEDVYKLASELYQYHKDNPTTSFDDLEFGEDYDIVNDWDYNDDNESEENEGEALGSRGGTSYDPSAETDNAFRLKEKSLLSDELFPYVYINLPKLNIKDFVVPHSKLYTEVDFSNIDNYDKALIFQGYSITEESISKESSVFNPGVLFKEYRDRNQKFIGYLIKEFELRRNAAQFARASVSKTGELDVEKIWSYKLKDDLFKRVTKIPNGKNHGMMMFVDWSGSMNNVLSSTIEQFLVLADFCRKVNIPFEVYSFSDSRLFFSNNKDDNYTRKYFSTNEKDLALRCSLSLLNLISSRMSNSQYRTAQIRLLQIAKAYDIYNDTQRSAPVARVRLNCVPKEMRLGGTPLNEAILVANYLVPEYKIANKIDVMNTIFLTDGEGVECKEIIFNRAYTPIATTCNSKNYNLILKDTDTNLTVTAKSLELVTNALLRMLQARSKTNLVGYFICSRNPKGISFNLAQTYGNPVTQESITEYVRKNRFYSVKNTGFDEYFVVQGKDLDILDDTLQVESSEKREVMKAFIKNQKSKILNRVFLNKFIEQIAA